MKLPKFRPESPGPSDDAVKTPLDNALSDALGRIRPLRFLPLALCLAYAVFVLVLGRHYTIGTYENADFYSRYAPDADRIARGVFPADPYTGPGYALLLRFANLLFSDPFIAGKWIAAVVGALCGLVTFSLFRRLFGLTAALVSLVVLFSATEYAVLSIDPGSDIVFLFLCVSALAVFLHPRFSPLQRVVFAAAISGYAYITRYNGLFLPAVFVIAIVLINCFSLSWKERFRFAAIHSAVFLVVVSPWLWLNYKHRGSPFYNMNYLNIATNVFDYPSDSDGVQQAGKVFKSFGDVLLEDPARFIKRYLRSLYETLRFSLAGSFLIVPVALVALVAVPYSLARRFKKDVVVLLTAGILYSLIMSLSHWENRYYMFIKVLYIGLAAFIGVSVTDRFVTKGGVAARVAPIAAGAVVLALVVVSGLSSARDARALATGEPVGIRAAVAFMKTLPSEGSMVSRKPQLPYLTGHRHQLFPIANSVEELRSELAKTSAKYLVFDQIAEAARPKLSALADPNNGIAWLSPRYVDDTNGIIIYAINPAG